MNVLNKKIPSLFIVSGVYLLAIAAGVCSYIFIFQNTNVDIWIKLLVADVIATTVVYIFSCIFRNASMYDAYWSVQPIVIVLGFFIVSKITIFSILALIAVLVWGIRLTINWIYTFDNLKWIDWRYKMLKEKTGIFYPIINYLGIHMFPTLVVYSVIIPVVYGISMEVESNVGTYIFFIFAILSAVLQGVADCQMHAYRKNRTTPFMRKGLWKHSRHPNYLGEINMWWSMGFMSVLSLVLTLDNSLYWIFLVGALVNTVMFLVVSIPMADKRQSRKEGFDQYKKETFMLLPMKKWWVKK